MFLMRGYITRWLEDIGDFDASSDLESILAGTEDMNEKTLRFVQQLGRDIPFAFGGYLITLQNLLLIADKILKREFTTVMEQKIANLVADGRLLSYLESFMKKVKTNNRVENLTIPLQNLKGKSSKDIVGLLDFYLNPQNYYCPFVKNFLTPEDVARASIGLQHSPMLMKDWERINIGNAIPDSLLDKMNSAASYWEAFSSIEMLQLAIKNEFSSVLESYGNGIASYFEAEKIAKEFFEHRCSFMKNWNGKAVALNGKIYEININGDHPEIRFYFFFEGGAARIYVALNSNDPMLHSISRNEYVIIQGIVSDFKNTDLFITKGRVLKVDS